MDEEGGTPGRDLESCSWRQGAYFTLRPINLGLDLQGGIHVVLEGVETPELPLTEDAMNRALAVIDRRVNALGVTEPVLQRLGIEGLSSSCLGLKTRSKPSG